MGINILIASKITNSTNESIEIQIYVVDNKNVTK